ncbi:MAG: DNA polymerase IV [Patescibacteria group bacterium]|jgi:nucleotidyltransferase/DNA polymerase involved in DNA repair
MKPVILHCDLDAFFASVEEVLHPELKGKPLIVGGNPEKHPKTRGIVACPSYAARALGIKTAMPLKKAYRIAPQAIYLEGSFAHYRQFSERFFQILAEYSNHLEPRSLDEAFIDVTPITSWVMAHELAQEIRDRVRTELGLAVSIGVGTSKTIAKIASEEAKPNGMCVVHPGTEERFLAPLPASAMPGIGKQTQKYLRMNGLHTIGDIARLPERRVIQLFGWRGTILQDRARGIDTRPVKAYEDVKSVGHAHTFNDDLTDTKALLSTASYLLEKAASRLRRHNTYAHVIKITIRYYDFTTESKQLRLQHPTDDQHLLYEKIEQLFHVLRKPRPIRLIGVTLSELTPNPRQHSFPFSRLMRIQHIQRAVDTLRDRFGFEAVLSGSTMPVKRAFGNAGRTLFYQR